MSDRIHSEKFNFWVKAVLGLQITKEGLYDFVRNEVKAMVSPFPGDDAHFARFLDKVVFGEKRVNIEYTSKRGGDFKWTFRSNCKSKACTNIFDIILQNHARNQTKSINWRCHDTPKTISPSIHWWIVAKFYMPGNNEQSTGPEQVDPLSLLTLLVNCKVFEKIKFQAQVVIDVRNVLMHNATNTISETDMKASFRKMTDLLREDDVKKTSQKQLHDITKLEEESMFLINASQEDHEMVVKALELKQKALMNDIIVNPGKATSELEQILKRTKQEIEQEYTSKKQNEIRRIEEVQKLRERVSCLEDECNTFKEKYEEEHREKNQLVEENDLLLNKAKTVDENIRVKTEETEKLEMTIAQLKQPTSESKTKESILESVITGATAGSTVGLSGGLPGAVAGAAIGVVAAGTKAVITKMVSRN